MKKKQVDILNSAIKTFGTEKQLEMVVEECAELILAIQKYKRSPSESTLETMLLQETADVEIMIKQIRLIFGRNIFKRIDYQMTGNEIIDFNIAFKLDRLQKRVEQNNFELK